MLQKKSYKILALIITRFKNSNVKTLTWDRQQRLINTLLKTWKIGYYSLLLLSCL